MSPLVNETESATERAKLEKKIDFETPLWLHNWRCDPLIGPIGSSLLARKQTTLGGAPLAIAAPPGLARETGTVGARTTLSGTASPF